MICFGQMKNAISLVLLHLLDLHRVPSKALVVCLLDLLNEGRHVAHILIVLANLQIMPQERASNIPPQRSSTRSSEGHAAELSTAQHDAYAMHGRSPQLP